jgi:predicted HicB family RNase H-like nuclease
MVAEQVDSLKALTVRVPEPLHRDAKLLAVQRGESLNGIMRELLESWVRWAKENPK